MSGADLKSAVEGADKANTKAENNEVNERGGAALKALTAAGMKADDPLYAKVLSLRSKLVTNLDQSSYAAMDAAVDVVKEMMSIKHNQKFAKLYAEAKKEFVKIDTESSNIMTFGRLIALKTRIEVTKSILNTREQTAAVATTVTGRIEIPTTPKIAQASLTQAPETVDALDEKGKQQIQAAVNQINAALKAAGLIKYNLSLDDSGANKTVTIIDLNKSTRTTVTFTNSNDANEARSKILQALGPVLGGANNLKMINQLSSTPASTGSETTTTTLSSGTIVTRTHLRRRPAPQSRPTAGLAAAPLEAQLTKETSKAWLDKNATTKDGVTTFNNNSAKTLGEVLSHLHQGKEHTLFFRQPAKNNPVIEGVFDKDKKQYFPKGATEAKKTHANRIMFWRGTSFADSAEKLQKPSSTPSASAASGPRDKYDAPPKKPLEKASLYIDQLKQFVPEMSKYKISAITVENGPDKTGADYNTKAKPHTVKVSTFTLKSHDGSETKTISLNKPFDLYKALTMNAATPATPATVGLKSFKAVAKEITAAITAAITTAITAADKAKYAKKAVTENNPTTEKINQIEPPRLRQAILALQNIGAKIISYTLLNSGENKIKFEFPVNSGEEYDIGPIKYLNKFARKLEKMAKILPLWQGLKSEAKVDWNSNDTAIDFDKNEATTIRWGNPKGITVSINNVIDKPERLKGFVESMKKFDENKKWLKANGFGLDLVSEGDAKHPLKKIETFNRDMVKIQAFFKNVLKGDIGGSITIFSKKVDFTRQNRLIIDLQKNGKGNKQIELVVNNEGKMMVRGERGKTISSKADLVKWYTDRT